MDADEIESVKKQLKEMDAEMDVPLELNDSMPKENLVQFENI